MENSHEQSAMTPLLAEGLAQFAAAAVRITSQGLARLPPVYRQQLRESIDAGDAAFTVQIDLPSGNVRVLVDGKHWIGPQVLFAAELPEKAPVIN